MRIGRKLFMLAVVAVAAMAFAPSAFAQSSAVEVSEEHETGNVHCSDVTMADEGHAITGGCELHATSNGAVILRQGATVISACLNEFEANVDESGHGWIHSQELVDIPGMGNTCVVEPCSEDGGTVPPDVYEEWEFQIEETGAPEDETEHMIVDFCLSLEGGDMAVKQHCELEVEIDDLSSHEYLFSSPVNECDNLAGRTVQGSWSLEFGDDHEGENVEVHHENDEVG